MSAKTVPAETAFAEWRKDPAYVAAYEALGEEFDLAQALIEVRSQANMTQEQVAAKTGTTQTAIARLEGGRSMSSTRTLQRYAAATGFRLRISFTHGVSPADADSQPER